MYDYYFKIKKGDIEFECSTTDKVTFEQQLSDWINGLVTGVPLKAPTDETEQENRLAEPKDFQEKAERSGFIDIKNLASINDMATAPFEFNEDKISFSEQEANFEAALNESFQNPKTEVVEKAEDTFGFEGYFSKYAPTSNVDKLIVAAMYTLNEENLERFTIKQINSKIVPLCGNPIVHADVQEAIEQGYVKVVPDLTETSELTEYTLTESGEGYFVA